MVTLDQAGQARGWTRIVPPPRALAPFVELFWAQADAPAGGSLHGWRIVPDASPHLIVKRLRGIAGDPVPAGSSTRAILVGARSHHVDSDMPDRTWTAGVRFRPGVLPVLTGLPASEVADRGVSVEDAFGAAGRQVERDLADAACADRAIGMLRDALLARLVGASPPDRRIRGLIRLARAAQQDTRSARPGVRTLADRLGVPTRTLRQRCADDIGLSPVLVMRIGRLHHALRLALAGAPPGGWAAIAVRTGYFDQSHLIRDCRLLLGESPGEFLRRSVY
jgi:AraC-like DNA-binding protein